MLDKNGKETNAILAQKATTVMQSLLKIKGFELGNYHGLFDSMPINLEPNQEFLEWISHIEIKKEKTGKKSNGDAIYKTISKRI